jgi:23S rRNA (guanosine2251-2'-O)-methyltransferase
MEDMGQPAVVLEGRVSIEAAILGGVRPVFSILAIQPGDRRLAFLRRLAAEAGIPIEAISRDELRSHATGGSHGGVIGLAGERRYLTVSELLAGCGPRPLLVMLDGVEDPFNFGQAVRSVYAAGAHGLIVRQRSWDQAAGLLARASAGASELLATASVPFAETAAAACRARGIKVACATTQADAEWINDADLTQALLVVIGGERRGVTRSFVDRADVRLRIPYGRRGAHALGTAASAAVIAFEALRQRRAAGLDAETSGGSAGGSAAKSGGRGARSSAAARGRSADRPN